MELCCTEAACSTLLTATGSRLTTSWGFPGGLVQGWLLSPGLAVGAEEAGVGGEQVSEQLARDPGLATPSERRWEAWPGFGLCSVCLWAGSEPGRQRGQSRP